GGPGDYDSFLCGERVLGGPWNLGCRETLSLPPRAGGARSAARLYHRANCVSHLARNTRASLRSRMLSGARCLCCSRPLGPRARISNRQGNFALGLFRWLGVYRHSEDLWEALFHVILERGRDIVNARDRKIALHHAVAGNQN